MIMRTVATPPSETRTIREQKAEAKKTASLAGGRLSGRELGQRQFGPLILRLVVLCAETRHEISLGR